MISKEKKEKSFRLNLEKDLEKIDYKLSDMCFEKDEENNAYNFLLNGNIVVYFDDYSFGGQFIHFYNKGIHIISITKPREISKYIKPDNYLRAEHDKRNLEEYKSKIRQLILVDKKIKITQIAEELGITRQAIYKNTDLKKFIDSLK